MRSQSGCILDSYSETNPFMLLPFDLQLEKEFEEQVPVMMLLIVANALCVMAQS